MRIHPRGAVLAGLAIGLAALGAAGSVSAAGNTLRIDPPSQSVASGATFTVKVIQNAAVTTSGVQATVTFDRTKLQITSATWGGPWINAPILAPGILTKAIATANITGKLKTLAAAYVPPDSVPAGDADALIITFTAKACGTVALGLPVGPLDAAMTDGVDPGKSLKVTTVGGTVTICAAATTPTPAGSSPTPTPAGNATPLPTPAPGDSTAPSASPGDSGTPSASPGDTTAPSASPADSAAPSASVSPSASATAASPPGGSDGGPPWIPIGLAVIVVAAGGGLLVRRSMRT